VGGGQRVGYGAGGTHSPTGKDYATCEGPKNGKRKNGVGSMPLQMKGRLETVGQGGSHFASGTEDMRTLIVKRQGGGRKKKNQDGPLGLRPNYGKKSNY